MVALTALFSLVAPADSPEVEYPWAMVEAQLGLRLPSDFKAMVESYGSGSFDDFLWLLLPAETNPNLDLVIQRRVRTEALRGLRDDGEEVPYALERDHEDLLPWAITDNGDVCFWVMSSSSDPDNWTVTINEARGSRWVTAEMSASAFLVEVLSGALKIDLFPDDFPSETLSFKATS